MKNEHEIYTIKIAGMLGLGTDPPRKETGGRYLVEPDTNRFYWEGEEEARTDPPAFLSGLRFGEKLPRPYKVDSLGGGRSLRGKAKTALLYELDDYVKRFKPKADKQSDHYNPFGRFNTAKATSFYPNPKNPGAETIYEALAKDKSFKRIESAVEDGEYTTSGYPMEVVVAGGQVLELVDETALGAVYAEGRLPERQAARDMKRVGKLKALQLNVEKAEPIKIVPPTEITKTVMQAFEGEKRSMSQAQVMGASAAAAAENAGYAPNEGAGWEWLHLIAHSMGGLATQGPQVAANLVAGTAECNTQMIIVEEFIKDYISRWEGTAHLCVMAEMSDRERHIGGTIRYHFYLSNKEGHPVEVYIWTFDALSRNNPMTMQNRALRTAGREVLKDGGVGTLKKKIEPAPKTDSIELIENKLVELVKGKAPREVVETLLASKNDFGGEVPDWVFAEIGERATVEQWNDYADLIGEAFGDADRDSMAAGAQGVLVDHVEKAGFQEIEALWTKLLDVVKIAGKVVTSDSLLEIIGESVPQQPDLLNAWFQLAVRDFGPDAGTAVFGVYVRERVSQAAMQGDEGAIPGMLLEAARRVDKSPSAASLQDIGRHASMQNIGEIMEEVKRYGEESAEVVYRAFLLKVAAQGNLEDLGRAFEPLRQPPDMTLLLEIGEHAHLRNIDGITQAVAGYHGEENALAVRRACVRNTAFRAAERGNLQDLQKAFELMDPLPEMTLLLDISGQASILSIEMLTFVAAKVHGEANALAVRRACVLSNALRAAAQGNRKIFIAALKPLGQPPDLPMLLEIGQQADTGIMEVIGELFGKEALKVAEEGQRLRLVQ